MSGCLKVFVITFLSLGVFVVLFSAAQTRKPKVDVMDAIASSEPKLSNDLTPHEMQLFAQAAESAVRSALERPDDARLGVFVWEPIDRKPINGVKRYAIDHTIKIATSSGARVSGKVRALASVTLRANGSRDAKLEFVNLDGRSVFIDEQ